MSPTNPNDLDLAASIMSGVAIKKAGIPGKRVVNDKGEVIGQLEREPDPFAQGLTVEDGAKVIKAALDNAHNATAEAVSKLVDEIGALALKARDARRDINPLSTKNRFAIENRIEELRTQMDLKLKDCSKLLGDLSANPEFAKFRHMIGAQLEDIEALFRDETA